MAAADEQGHGARHGKSSKFRRLTANAGYGRKSATKLHEHHARQAGLLRQHRLRGGHHVRKADDA